MEVDKLATRIKELELLLAEASNREREMDSVFENSHDGLCFADPQGHPIRYNRAYCQILGVSPDEIVGISQEEVISRGLVSESATLNAIRTGRGATTLPVLKTGKRALITAQPIFDDDGKLFRLVANVRDMTELMSLKEQLDAVKQLSNQYYNEILLLRGNALQGGMIAVSSNIRAIRNKAIKVAPTDVTVLVCGESGVGKEVLAKEIHNNSLRKDGPFIKINCASTPPSLMESEYFGYARGAFTNASQSGKMGLFALANKGTLFLDEIGELPLDMQSKLLAVLQDKKFLPVGGVAEVELNARIIAATNRNMLEMVQQGLFRRDLYYRLNIVNLEVPPLRQRMEDLLALTSYLLKRFNEEYKTANALAPGFVKALELYEWPGNVRELSNLIEQMVALYPNETLDASHLPEHFLHKSKRAELQNAPLCQMLENFEYTIFESLLEQPMTSYQLAKKLGVNQSTVIRKLKKFNLLGRLKGNTEAETEERKQSLPGTQA